MPVMTIVYDETEDGLRQGDVTEHFIAIWGDKRGAHVLFCAPPEWEDLVNSIRDVLDKHKPFKPVLDLPHAPEPDWYES